MASSITENKIVEIGSLTYSIYDTGAIQHEYEHLLRRGARLSVRNNLQITASRLLASWHKLNGKLRKLETRRVEGFCKYIAKKRLVNKLKKKLEHVFELYSSWVNKTLERFGSLR